MGDDREPRARLTYLFKYALLELHRLHEQHLAPLGISGRELALMLDLDGHVPESQQETAERLGVDRTTMVALVDSLEEKRLVARRPDARDRRRNVVELTKAGRTTLPRALRASDRAERELLGGMSAEEAEQLRALLARISRG
jgi:DNA-binding MarR family transcriptional regulator